MLNKRLLNTLVDIKLYFLYNDACLKKIARVEVNDTTYQKQE